jgi:DNA-binding CsgD family transcriptional regulator
MPDPANLRATPIGGALLLLSVPAGNLRLHALRSLTPAERAVALLAAEGFSNEAIARRRRCSVRTVANQLASAYGKMGIAGRRQLRARMGHAWAS